MTTRLRRFLCDVLDWHDCEVEYWAGEFWLGFCRHCGFRCFKGRRWYRLGPSRLTVGRSK